jgi:hypothetical protein
MEEIESQRWFCPVAGHGSEVSFERANSVVRFGFCFATKSLGL